MPGGAGREQRGRVGPAAALAERGEDGARGGEAGVGGEECACGTKGVQDEDGTCEEVKLGEFSWFYGLAGVWRGTDGAPYFEAQDAQVRAMLSEGKWRMLPSSGRPSGPGGEFRARRERRKFTASTIEPSAATRTSWNTDLDELNIIEGRQRE